MKFQVPMIILSYGEFYKTKRLFVYEHDSVVIMPIFYNVELATKFKEYFDGLLKKLGDNRSLAIQVCDSRQAACDIFKVSFTIFPELCSIVIDPDICDDAIISGKPIGLDEIVERLHDDLAEEH